jgi:hypothetical protein
MRGDDEHSEVDDLFELTRVRDELMLGSGIEPRDGAPLTERDQQRARLKVLFYFLHEFRNVCFHSFMNICSGSDGTDARGRAC